MVKIWVIDNNNKLITRVFKVIQITQYRSVLPLRSICLKRTCNHFFFFYTLVSLYQPFVFVHVISHTTVLCIKADLQQSKGKIIQEQSNKVARYANNSTSCLFHRVSMFEIKKKVTWLLMELWHWYQTTWQPR